jgi:hypothetical protein
MSITGANRTEQEQEQQAETGVEQYDNPEDARQIRSKLKDKKSEQEQEAREAESTLQQISRQRSEKTLHVRIEGRRVEFAPLKGEYDEIEDLFLDLGGVDEDDLTEEQAERYRAGRERIIELLNEKCKEGDSTLGYWRSEFDGAERQEILRDLAEGGTEGNRQ